MSRNFNEKRKPVKQNVSIFYSPFSQLPQHYWQKSSETKQRLCIKFLKTKTLEDESKYKNYKSLFEKLRKKAKIAYYLKLLHKYKTDSKRTWQVMKKITGKKKKKNQIFSPEKLKLAKPLSKPTGDC